MAWTIRLAVETDLDFLVRVDLKDEGITDLLHKPMSAVEQAAHRAKIANFIEHPSEGAWVAVDEADGQRVGMILCRFRDRTNEPRSEMNAFLFKHLGDSWLPADGRFCEIFQLWVAPDARRQGLATRLKNTVEDEARRRAISMIYTHTESRNEHVIEMNRKLGYVELRRGPLWDEIERISLIKTLSLLSGWGKDPEF